jgi:hypothetical protein
MSERASYWREVLGECEQSGLTRVEFCRRRGINAGTLAWWKRQFKRMDNGHRATRRGQTAADEVPAFVELAAAPNRGGRSRWRAWPAGVLEACGSGGPSSAGHYAVVLPNGVELRLGDGFDPAQVAGLVQALLGVSEPGHRAARERGAAC